jgi:hypothetical protein
LNPPNESRRNLRRRPCPHHKCRRQLITFRKVSLGTDPNCVALYGTNSVPCKQWSHIAVTSDGTQYQIPPPKEEYRNFIGKMDRMKETRYFFKGKIDDLRVYNRPLTAEEVKALVNPPPKPAKPQ